jgi:EAL domain-containing protein (putative c-di-GMP-specific phosphodiesterase class I)
MPMRPLRILVLGAPHFQRLISGKMRSQPDCQEIFEVADWVHALAIIEQVGPMDITLCDLRFEGVNNLELLQSVGRSGLMGAIIICSPLPAEVLRAVRQIVSPLGMVLLGDFNEYSPLRPLQALLEKQKNNSFEVPVSPPVAALVHEEDVRQAFAQRQLQTWFQPKFDLLTGEVCSIEALARWHHPFKGVMPPSVFIPAIEQCGLLDELLFMQLEQGLNLQRQASEQGFSLTVAFNLQVSQLANPHLIPRIRMVLDVHDLPGSGLMFELTETGLLEVPSASLERLTLLRLMGCGLSIDDFGAGFSSLQRLCQLPFNEIKLDAGFVRGVMHEPRCRAVISSTLALGDALGMAVVAEGIETEEQRQLLLELGCTHGQGYWCARPMPGADLLHWLNLQQTASNRFSVTS